MYEVYSPIGAETLKPTSLSKNLTDLDNKVIGESWNGDFKGDQTFPIIRAILKARFPRLRFVTYDNFPYHHGADNPSAQRRLAKDIAIRARELGCDALISGNGA